MRGFRVVCLDPECCTRSITVADATGILHAFRRLGCEQAEVLQEGAYCFTVRLQDDGLWHIFRRDGEYVPEDFDDLEADGDLAFAPRLLH